MKNTKFNLGDGAFLEFGLTALIKIGKSKIYVPCKKNDDGVWSFGETSGKVLCFLNTVTIKGKPEDHIKIGLKDRNGTLEPFTKNSLKKFSSKEVITVEIEDLQSETSTIFTVFRTAGDKGKELHVKEHYKYYLGPLFWDDFPQKLKAALVSY